MEEENERLHEELSKYGSVESLKFLLEDAIKQLSDTKEQIESTLRLLTHAAEELGK